MKSCCSEVFGTSMTTSVAVIVVAMSAAGGLRVSPAGGVRFAEMTWTPVGIGIRTRKYTKSIFWRISGTSTAGRLSWVVQVTGWKILAGSTESLVVNGTGAERSGSAPGSEQV